MGEAVLAALITGALALAGTVASGLFSSRRSSRDMDHKLEMHNAVTDAKLEALTDEVRKHNNLVERTYRLEEENRVQDEKIAVANHRIEDLERAVGRHHG